MKVVGLIAEYNPFHNGHQYHIEKAMQMTGADAAVILMSGDFVQRGTPAIMPKHLRAQAALQSGASVVLELPVCFAASSAEYFARGAISIFEALGCIDSICFGSECGDYESLNKIAHILAEEPEEFRTQLQNYLKKGLSFPHARRNALEVCTGDPKLAGLLDLPNNTLGIEYLKAVIRTGSPIKAYTLKREGAGYHDTGLNQNYSSASAIRRLLALAGNPAQQSTESECDEPLFSDILTQLGDHIPPSCARILSENHRVRYPVCANDFSLLLKYRLLPETKNSLTEYADVTPDLANRIMNQRNSFISWDQFCDLLKTREVTFTRISRILLHILLGIRQSDMEAYAAHGFAQYARILGFSKADSMVLKEMKEHSRIPLISKLAAAEGLSGIGIHMLDGDVFAADLYESVVTEKYHYPFINEYEQQIRIV